MAYEYINHVVAVRIRALGTGNLQTRLTVPGEEVEQILTDLVMSSTSNRPKTLLSNFKQPKIQVECKTTEIDEHFEIRELTLYVKPIATGYPQ